MAGYNNTWDEWDNLHLLLDERVSGFLRRELNFVMDGYQLTDPALGLVVEVGQLGLNLAYCNGYELKQNNSSFHGLVDATTNYVYLAFTKTVDPGGGYSAIALAIVVNQTGVPPTDSIKLGEVDTAAGIISAIRNENNKYHIHSAQMDDDIDGNLNTINRLVIQAGSSFPTTPAPIAGELFFRTDLTQLYVHDGAVWQPLTPGTPSGTIILTADPLGVPILPGEIVYVTPTAPLDTVTQADAIAMATAEAIGVSTAVIAPGTPGPFVAGHGTPVTVFMGPTTVPPLLPGQKVWLDQGPIGAATNVPPPNPTARKVLGVVTDPTAWPGVPYANILWSPEPTIWVP